MRYIKDIPDQRYKIGIYQWNNKYIIKIESGLYEQTYKIEEYEVASVAELESVFDENFMNCITARFDAMDNDFMLTLRRNEIIF
ncbi:hypothetical protein [Dyadobacter helix]|nr:hypothetical protein [Dyadobacter sp. CECT 9275]